MVGLEFKGRDSTGGLDGIAVELDRMTEEEVEDTVDPENPPLLWAAHHRSGPRHKHVPYRATPDP